MFSGFRSQQTATDPAVLDILDGRIYWLISGAVFRGSRTSHLQSDLVCTYTRSNPPFVCLLQVVIGFLTEANGPIGSS